MKKAEQKDRERRGMEKQLEELRQAKLICSEKDVPKDLEDAKNVIRRMQERNPNEERLKMIQLL